MREQFCLSKEARTSGLANVQSRVCGDEPNESRILDDRELLRRLVSIRVAHGPALADQATRRAAVAIARTVHEFAEHRARTVKRNDHAMANSSNDAAKIGENPTAEEGCLHTVSRHEETS